MELPKAEAFHIINFCAARGGESVIMCRQIDRRCEADKCSMRTKHPVILILTTLIPCDGLPLPSESKLHPQNEKRIQLILAKFLNERTSLYVPRHRDLYHTTLDMPSITKPNHLSHPLHGGGASARQKAVSEQQRAGPSQIYSHVGGEGWRTYGLQG